MAQPLLLVNLIKRAFPGRFWLARLTRWPPIGRLVDRLLFHGDDLLYLPRAAAIPIGVDIEPPGGVALPQQVVEHFIRRASHRWIMNACLCRDAAHCQDYPIDLGCLFLGDAVLGINPKLGRLVSEKEALAHARRGRAAGLVHLIGRNRLDAVWLGVGPGDRLLTICHCCPCCCLWKVLPELPPRIAGKVSRLPGLRVVVGPDCAGCGACTAGVCFVDAIHLDGAGRAQIGPDCRGCGRCVELCPNGAITLTIEDPATIEAAVARIAGRVDVS